MHVETAQQDRLLCERSELLFQEAATDHSQIHGRDDVSFVTSVMKNKARYCDRKYWGGWFQSGWSGVTFEMKPQNKKSVRGRSRQEPFRKRRQEVLRPWGRGRCAVKMEGKWAKDLNRYLSREDI